MAMTIGILKETATDEARVATTPDTVKKLVAMGTTVIIEAGAGLAAFYPDDQYMMAGARIAQNAAEVWTQSDVIFTVQPPTDVVHARPGTILVGLANPYVRRDLVSACAAQNITLMAMELVPRITRAQALDALSSQANIAGYRAVIEAASYYTRALPMMMTAAGTIAAAKVFVMGAGVAGLQAIATARRLGAVVSATDVRLAAKEQVESLGAKFVMVEDDETKAAETSGGYAREMSDTYKQKQAALIAETIKKQDIVITTALIPGRPAPKLVSAEMVSSMRPGSVIVDMAVESGGNCALSRMGDVIMEGGVTLIGHRNLPARIATDSSALYARNLLSLFGLMYNKDTGAVTLSPDDEIIKAMTITKDGAIIHDSFKGA